MKGLVREIANRVLEQILESTDDLVDKMIEKLLEEGDDFIEQIVVRLIDKILDGLVDDD